MPTQQQVNWVGRQVERAQRILDIRDDIRRDIALYNAEDFGTALTDVELGTHEATETYTQSDIWNVVTAQQELLDALGDDVSGQAINLIKMRR